MVESLVVFLLGALVAGFLALIVAPIFMRRTARLVERRVRATAPLSLAEINSEKDLLRADFAVRLRKLEVQLETAKTAAARREMELGRQTQDTREASIELAAKKMAISEMEDRIGELNETVLRLEKQVSEQNVALRERQNGVSSAKAKLEERDRELEAAATLADEWKVEIVALKTQLENLQDRIEDMRAELAAKSIEAENRGAHIEELTGVIKSRDAVLAALEKKLAASETEIARFAGTGERGDLDALRENISSLAARIVTQTAATGDDEIRKLINGVSVAPRKEGDARGHRSTLAERIKVADLQPGE